MPGALLLPTGLTREQRREMYLRLLAVLVFGLVSGYFVGQMSAWSAFGLI